MKRFVVTDILADDYLLEGLDEEEQIYLPKKDINFILENKDIVLYDETTNEYFKKNS